ncbi:hypothetical protein EJ05DRAFT_469361 [Pseudovirgaria hyperparasitica]|uniref:Mannosyltransferase n=1 Tax=Pseudovirgaria hyperparasitica TaxID=470096 RepID=A0A6A6VX27_9PEZI|nr:uncharacterized protein EJ05DRAFT_469361 [Pseudovirgaria hyperparasitica]KAF2754264.1 hypothetical protein EJ05DRAFT_469361 [Pseudovirgaria hyperparasitica]
MTNVKETLLAVGIVVPVIFLHLLLAPYTKVEESFNTQAIHDIIYHGIPYSDASGFFELKYDHTSYPGSVPRTFVGALVTAGITRPWVSFVKTSADVQTLARAAIGLYNGLAIVAFKAAVDASFGRLAGIWYLLLQASQFHVVYYASRPLPNMFAFGMSTIALRSLLLGYSTLDRSAASKQYRLCLYLLTVAGIIFRAELAVLLTTVTLYLITRKSISIKDVILPAGIAGVTMGLLVTVAVDSFFWQQSPIWPELAGFIFNTIQGHSSEWGVSPWWFYFGNSLPKILLNPFTFLVLIPLALLNPALRPRSLDILLPPTAFVAIYSVLPHKEWRFIIYIVPLLTTIASAGASWIWIRRSKTLINRLLALAMISSVVLSFVGSTAMLTISSWNYPGAIAITRLHGLVGSENAIIRVHLDNLSCQTGVSRFLQKRTGIENRAIESSLSKIQSQTVWVYDKTGDEATLLNPSFWNQFDYALVERPEKTIGKWEVLDTIDGFSGVRIVKPGAHLLRRECAPSSLLCQPLRSAESFVREKITKGWWMDFSMEPKIHILKKQIDQS